MMKETTFPERTRCKACRKKLDAIVLKGVFCSYACAGAKTPSTKVADAPRHCKREVNGSWDFKTKFRSSSDVPAKLQADPATNIYECDYCLFMHVGHSRPAEFTKDKMRRTVSDLSTIGSVVKRAREERNVPIALLAKKMKIPSIRLQEIEVGSKQMDISILLEVLRIFKIQVILQEK